MQKSPFDGMDVEDTNRTFRKSPSNLRKGSNGQRSLSKIDKYQDEKINNRPRQATGRTSR